MTDTWTEAEIELVKECRGQGIAIKEVAHRVKRNYRAVRRLMHKLELSGAIQPCDQSHRRWKAAEITRVKEMLAEGASRRKIADALGRTFDSVRWQVDRIRGTAPHATPKRRWGAKDKTEQDHHNYKYIRKQRVCLWCRKSFESAWIGKRLCENCNAAAGRRGGAFG